MADNQIDELPELPDITTIIGKPEPQNVAGLPGDIWRIIFGFMSEELDRFSVPIAIQLLMLKNSSRALHALVKKFLELKPRDNPGKLTVMDFYCSKGFLECVKYAHGCGFPWHDGCCTWAASYGHLDVLKYLHENGCRFYIVLYWPCTTF